MWLNKIAGGIESIITKLSYVFLGIAAGVLAMMMFLTAADVAGRRLFSSPVAGAFEVTELGMAMMFFFGLAYTHLKKGNVQIDLVLSHLPRKAQVVIDSITLLLCAALMAVVSWQSFLTAQNWMKQGYVTSESHIPLAPFLFVAVGCSAVFSLVFVIGVVHSLAQAVKR